MNAGSNKGIAETGRYAAIILAAGYSSRMGAFKPLLPLGGKPAVQILIETARAAGLSPVVVVTGHNREELEHAVHAADAGVCTVYNEHYPEGMFSSICKGLSFLQEESRAGEAGGAAGSAEGIVPAGCFVMPVDCPLTGAESLSTMLAAIEDRQAQDTFAVPTYEGKKGHPLYVPACRWEEILRHDGAGGLNAVTYRYQDTMLRIPVSREGAVMDMDTWEDYEALQAYLENGSGPSLAEMAKGRRFFLVRHGQIRQHEEPIFLGRTDVPLGEEGLRQAEEAARELALRPMQISCVYTSPLSRAVQTAGAIAAAIGKETETVAGFSEMSLGPWDGRYIREIREEEPAAFEARGRDLFAFKTGPGSENFFDLQYRAVRALKKILQEDPALDLMIVAHKGTLRVLENNLLGKRAEDPWQTIETGGWRLLTL